MIDWLLNKDLDKLLYNRKIHYDIYVKNVLHRDMVKSFIILFLSLIYFMVYYT